MWDALWMNAECCWNICFQVSTKLRERNSILGTFHEEWQLEEWSLDHWVAFLHQWRSIIIHRGYGEKCTTENPCHNLLFDSQLRETFLVALFTYEYVQLRNIFQTLIIVLIGIDKRLLEITGGELIMDSLPYLYAILINNKVNSYNFRIIRSQLYSSVFNTSL